MYTLKEISTVPYSMLLHYLIKVENAKMLTNLYVERDS